MHRMVTTPYYRGRNREYKAMQILRGEGWVCSRSAMSHGPVDVFAAKRGRVLLVQVKSGAGRMSKEELSKFIEWGKAFRARSEIWYFKGRKGLTKQCAYAPRARTRIR